MDKELRILILEDSPADTELEEYELRKAGLVFTSKVVDTKETFLKALDEFLPDLILSDYDLPTFDGLAALRIAKEKCPDVPFILVTGKLGEEFAIDKLKDGATDYVLKGNLKRLVPVINRALEEAKLITERKRSEEDLKHKQAMLVRTESIAHFGSWEWDVATDTVTWSEELFRIFQRNPADGAPSFAEHPELYYPEDMQRLREAVEAAISNGTPYELELRAIRKDGATRVCLARGYVEMDAAKKVTHLFGSLQDITERKQAEESLRKEYNFAQNILNTVQAIILVLDTNGNIVSFNPYMEEISGYRLDEVKGKDWVSTFLPKEKQDRTRALFKKAISDIKTKGNVDSIITKDGRELYIEWYDTTMKGEDGEIIGLLSIGQDITDRKRTGDALREKEQRLASIYDTVGDVMFYLAVETEGQYRFVSVNQSFCRATGLSLEQIVGQTVSEVIPKPSLMMVLGKYQQAIEGKTIVRWEETSDYPTGRLTGEVSIAPIFDYSGRCTHLVGSVHDITERKRAEDDLRASEERYSIMANSSPNLLLVHKNGIIHYINDVGLRITGYHKDEVMGKSMFEFLSDDSKELAKKNMQRRLTGEHVEHYELKVITKSKDLKCFLVNAAVIPYEKETAFLVVLSDITERKNAQEAQKKSENKFRNLFNSASDAVAIHDMKGHFFEVNDTLCNRLGYSREELLHMTAQDIDTEENANHVQKRINTLKKQGYLTFETAHVSRDGKVIPVEVSSRIIDYEGEKTVLSVARDITKRKRVEEALRDSEKQYRLLFNGITDAVYFHEVAVEKPGKFIAVNDSACRMLGYTMDEFLQMQVKDIDIPEQSEKIPSIQEKLFRDGYALFETFHVAKDGRRIPVEVNIQLVELQGKSMVLAVARDITERKHTEDILQASEDKFHSLFNQAADLIAILDLQGNFIDLNQKFEEESRWSREEIIGKNVLTSGVVTEESVRHISFYLNQLIQGKEIPMFEIEGVIKDGGTVPYEIRATHIRKDGKTVAIQAILRNITERKQAMEAIETLRKQNLQILQSAGEGILGLDKEGKHTFANPSAAKMLGYSPDELIGVDSHKTWHYKKPDGTRYPEDECPILKSLQDGSIQTVDDEIFWKKDGTSFPIEYTTNPIEENGRIIGAVVTFRDITERRHMEEEIQKRVEDLQAFYEMAIGRELRMKELKEEMRELKERLEKFEKADN